MDIIVNNSLVLGQTYLSKDIVSGSLPLSVENTEQFVTANGLVVIGSIGSVNAELVQTFSKTATVINLGSATSFAHQRGEPVSQVTYNKVVIESSTSSTGTFSVIATIDIQWTSDKTQYNDPTGTSATYYRQRFYNSVTNQYSDYSNGGVGVATSSYGPTTAGSLIMSVRKAVGNTELTDADFISYLNDARRIANTSFGYGRINEWRHKFEYPIQMLAGTNYVNLPSDIDFDETNRSLLAARFARQSVAANIPIRYCDKREWNQRAYLNRYSVTSGATLSGATSLVLSSTGDFPTSGTIYVATELPTQTIMSVTFTSNNLLTNTLGGVSGITRNIADGVQVWAYSTFSIPFYFTVFDDPIIGTPRLWFDRPVPASLQGKNLYIDYYQAITDITFLTDVVPENYRDVYKDYMRFSVKRRRDDSIGEDDQDYIRFMNGLKTIMGNPYTGQTQIVIQ